MAGDEGDDVSFSDNNNSSSAHPHAISSPYLSYGGDGGNAHGSNNDDARTIRPGNSSNSNSNGAASKERPKTGKKRSSNADGSSASASANGSGGGSAQSGSGASRPKSASRRRETAGYDNNASVNNNNGAYDGSDRGGAYGRDEDMYPTARGFVRK